MLQNVFEGLSTEAKQNVIIAALTEAGIKLDAATLSALESILVGGTVELGEASLAALENISIDFTGEGGLASEATLALRATEATLATRATEATLETRASQAGQDLAIAGLASIDGHVDGIEAVLVTRATEATLADLLTAVATVSAQAALQATAEQHREDTDEMLAVLRKIAQAVAPLGTAASLAGQGVGALRVDLNAPGGIQPVVLIGSGTVTTVSTVAQVSDLVNLRRVGDASGGIGIGAQYVFMQPPVSALRSQIVVT